MIVILLLMLFGWTSISFGIEPMTIELRDSTNQVVATVNKRMLEALKGLNPTFRQRPVEEIKRGTQPTYRILTGLSKEQIQNMLLQVKSQLTSIPQPKAPEMSINW